MVAVSLGMLVTQPGHAVTVQNVTTVEVLDADNKRLGTFSYANGSVMMLLDHNVQAVRVKKSGFVSDWEALFASADCTGIPYMPASEADRHSNDLVDATLYKQIGSVIWVADPESTTTMVAMHSRGNLDQCSRKGEGLPPAGTAVIPLTELIDLNTLFTPPFRLRVK
jgi:hypothetical protein